jgi:hypothetical protein
VKVDYENQKPTLKESAKVRRQGRRKGRRKWDYLSTATSPRSLFHTTNQNQHHNLPSLLHSFPPSLPPKKVYKDMIAKYGGGNAPDAAPSAEAIGVPTAPAPAEQEAPAAETAPLAAPAKVTPKEADP